VTYCNILLQLLKLSLNKLIINDALFVLTDLVYVPSSEVVSQDNEGSERLAECNDSESETVSQHSKGCQRLANDTDVKTVASLSSAKHN